MDISIIKQILVFPFLLVQLRVAEVAHDSLVYTCCTVGRLRIFLGHVSNSFPFQFQDYCRSFTDNLVFPLSIEQKLFNAKYCTCSVFYIITTRGKLYKSSFNNKNNGSFDCIFLVQLFGSFNFNLVRLVSQYLFIFLIQASGKRSPLLVIFLKII